MKHVSALLKLKTNLSKKDRNKIKDTLSETLAEVTAADTPSFFSKVQIKWDVDDRLNWKMGLFTVFLCVRFALMSMKNVTFVLFHSVSLRSGIKGLLWKMVTPSVHHVSAPYSKRKKLLLNQCYCIVLYLLAATEEVTFCRWMFAFTSSVVQSVVCECFNCKLSFCIKLVEIVELSSSVIAVTTISPV